MDTTSSKITIFPKNFFDAIPLTLEYKPAYIEVPEEKVRSLTKANKQVRKGWMRNQLCPCGSGTKFKKCCWDKPLAKEVE